MIAAADRRGDDELLVACAGGDRAAFRLLYDREAARLLGVALRIVRRRDVAEDVVHEVFMVIWNSARGFDPAKGSARAWLSTVTRNRALNKLRGFRPSVDMDDAEVEALRDSADDPERVMERIDDTARLKGCLQALDEKKRACVMLAFINGYSQTEVASRLGVPHNTAKAWIRRGLLNLRECMQ